MSATEPTADEHINELFDIEKDDRDPFEDAEESSGPVEEPEPEPEPEPTSEATPSSDEVPAEEAEPVSSDESGEREQPAPSAADEEKAADWSTVPPSLKKELFELRAKRREWEAQRQAMQAPSPVREPQPQQPPPDLGPPAPPKIPVEVSEDGSSVFVSPTAIEPIVEERARQIVRDEMAPKPEQLAAEAWRRNQEEFVREDPETRAPIVHMVRQAEDYLEEALRYEMGRYGFQPQSVEHVMAFMGETGIQQKFSEHFPEIAPDFDHFFRASVSPEPGYRRMSLERIADARRSAAPSGDPTLPGMGERQVQDVSNLPRSMAQKGGKRSVSPDGEEAEFDALEREYREDILGFDDAKHKRYMELGRKLGKAGIAP